jgi:hypothetical protein
VGHPRAGDQEEARDTGKHTGHQVINLAKFFVFSAVVHSFHSSFRKSALQFIDSAGFSGKFIGVAPENPFLRG